MGTESSGRTWTQEHSLKDVVWLAKLLGVSRSWVYQGVEAGRIPAVRLGPLVRFDQRTIEAWLKERAASQRPVGRGD